MDGTRFDRFARLLGAARDRRDLARLLAGMAALAASPAAARQDEAATPTPGDGADAADNRQAGAQRCGERRDPCRRDGDCCSGLACVDRTCKRDRGACAGRGEDCNSSRDCCTGLTCTAGACEAGAGACKDEGRQCDRSRDCCDDLICTDNRCARKVPVKFERAWTGSGTPAGALSDPGAVAVDPEVSPELVYVADTGNDRVEVFDANGGFKRTIGTTSGDARLRQPAGIAVNRASGNIVVADTGNDRVVSFTDTGGFLDDAGSSGSGTERFASPTGVATTGSGPYRVFVADADNDRIQVLSLNSNEDRFTFTDDRFGSSGGGDGLFDRPTGLAANSSFIVVADTLNNRVQVFDRSDRTFVRVIGAATSPGDGDGELDGPRGVAIDDRDRVWVCDTNNDRVQVFAIDGTFQFAFDGNGSSGGRFDRPRGIAVVGDRDAGYRIYVADTFNGQIQKFTLPARR